MAPYDRASVGSGLPLLIVTDHGMGIHSIHQHDGSQEFEVKLMSSRLTPKKKNKQQPQQQQNDPAADTRFSAKRWAFKKIEKSSKKKSDANDNNSTKSKESKKQKQESKNNTAATLFSSGKKKQKQSSKKEEHRVSFNYETRIREIPHKSEISPELKALLWINFHDWQAIQNERQRISRAILYDNLTVETQTDELLLRGLETLIPDLATIRRHAIHTAKTLVLREQARARLEQEPLDAERLARWYASATKESRNAALEQAVDDFFQVIEDLRGGRSLGDIV